MHAIPAVADHQFGAFSKQQAMAAGWTRSALLHAVRVGRLHRLRPGIFVAGEIMRDQGSAGDQRRLAAAAAGVLLAMPSAVVSHASAAALAGQPLWRPPTRPCVTVPPRYTGDAAAAHLHRAAIGAAHRCRIGGLVSTSMARTIVDIGREHGIDDAIVAVDAALRTGVVARADIERCLLDCTRWPGIRRARSAIAFADSRAESPLESVSRLRLAMAGLPAPDLQTTIRAHTGQWRARVDFYWDEFGVVGEVDGKIKYVGDALWVEKQRQERLEETGLIIVRWGRAQLDDTTRLADRLRAAFARGSRRPVEERRWVAIPTPR